MSILDQLASYAGNWRGVNRLQDPHTNLPSESPGTAVITPILDGRFVRMDYTWSYQGSPQEGSLLIGYQAEADLVTAYWIDSWHMGDKVMECQGAAGKEDEISVLGSYTAPPGPDWGWRMVIRLGEGQQLDLVMTNITPEGEDYPAVEARFYRAQP